MADKQAKFYEDFAVRVILPEHICEESFDAVVLAVKAPETRKYFQSVLQEQGVPKEKIIDYQEHDVSLHRAPNSDKMAKNLLIYDEGGMGDRIIHKKVVETMIAMDPDIRIDIYENHADGFLRFLYQDTPQVQEIQYLPKGIYEVRRDSYQAALDFCATTWTRVDALKQPSLLSHELFSNLERMKKQAEQEGYAEGIPASVFYQRCGFRGIDCYRHAGADILPMKDIHVRIPSTTEGKKTFEQMGLGKYITLNCGNGDTDNLKQVAKSWPTERFETLIALLHDAYPDVEILELGAKDAYPLAGANRSVFGASYGLVREILAHSLLHIDIEGGLVHMATQLGTKCIVLFGPTQVYFFGYSQNINLKRGQCHGCCHLYSGDWNRCARGLSEPECMYSITPEMVMDHAAEYLEKCAFCR